MVAVVNYVPDLGLRDAIPGPVIARREPAELEGDAVAKLPRFVYVVRRAENASNSTAGNGTSGSNSTGGSNGTHHNGTGTGVVPGAGASVKVPSVMVTFVAVFIAALGLTSL